MSNVRWTWVPRYPGESADEYAARKVLMHRVLFGFDAPGGTVAGLEAEIPPPALKVTV